MASHVDNLGLIDFDCEELNPDVKELLLFDVDEEHEILLEVDMDVTDECWNDFTITQIPGIDDLQQKREETQPDKEVSDNTQRFFCPHCFKGYKRETFYHKHVVGCREAKEIKGTREFNLNLRAVDGKLFFNLGS